MFENGLIKPRRNKITPNMNKYWGIYCLFSYLCNCHAAPGCFNVLVWVMSPFSLCESVSWPWRRSAGAVCDDESLWECRGGEGGCDEHSGGRVNEQPTSHALSVLGNGGFILDGLTSGSHSLSDGSCLFSQNCSAPEQSGAKAESPQTSAKKVSPDMWDVNVVRECRLFQAWS